jgi:hypothetical protein
MLIAEYIEVWNKYAKIIAENGKDGDEHAELRLAPCVIDEAEVLYIADNGGWIPVGIIVQDAVGMARATFHWYDSKTAAHFCDPDNDHAMLIAGLHDEIGLDASELFDDDGTARLQHTIIWDKSR